MNTEITIDNFDIIKSLTTFLIKVSLTREAQKEYFRTGRMMPCANLRLWSPKLTVKFPLI